MKSGSNGDEFQSIYPPIATKSLYATINLVIAMSAAMTCIKKFAALVLRLNIVTILRTNQMEIAWAEFTPAASSAVGVMIDLAALFLILLNDCVIGVSGILSSLLVKFPDWPWRLTIIISMIVWPFIVMALARVPIERQMVMSGPFINIAAFWVGLGTAVG